MDRKHIKQELLPGLELGFNCEIDCVNNQSAPLLFILDYSPQSDGPLVSFALSLENYDENSFPNKCWITHKEVLPINGNRPRYYEEYKSVQYQDKQFYPFSVNLSDYKPKDVDSIKKIINRLYRHIKF